MKKENIFFLSFFVLIFIIYGQSLWGGFVFDDRGILEHQALLVGIENIFRVLSFPYWTIDAGLYRPVTLLSYSLNFSVFGVGAWGFHLVNLLIYFGIVSLVFVLLKKVFNKEWLAYLSALVFLVLPIHTEVVANITGRSELLALLFLLLTLFELTKEKPSYWLTGLWTFLAVGSKETAIAVAPLTLILVSMREGSIGVHVWKKYFLPISGIALGTLLYFFFRFFVLGTEHFLGVETSVIENSLLFAEPLHRIGTALGILWMYVSKTFWPANLCSDYSFNQIPVITTFFNTQVMLGLSVLIASFVSIIYFWKKNPFVSFASAILFFGFIVVSNIPFPIGTVAGERLFFFPSLGLAMILALVLSKIKWRWIPILLILVYGIVSFDRQSDWLSEERLFLSAKKCAPESVLSLSNAGTVYYFNGEYDKAAKVLERSREIRPVYSKGLNNLGLVYWKQGRNDEAREMYYESLKQKYPYDGAIENLVLLYISEGDRESALRWLRIMYPNAGDSALQNLF
ncbi:MAG: tetratricopeptide repeat protein [Candidatus Zambryskibacteria bacterium]|nr:tetratricopeptide repeat protein [Candidatus Zambryskibacteria bacterium]